MAGLRARRHQPAVDSFSSVLLKSQARAFGGMTVAGRNAKHGNTSPEDEENYGRYNRHNFHAALVAILVAILIGAPTLYIAWNQWRHPDTSIQQLLGQILGRLNPVHAEAAPSLPPAPQQPSQTATPPPPTTVAFHALSTDPSLAFTSADHLTYVPGSSNGAAQLNLHLVATKGASKVYVAYPATQHGWSVSSETGNVCHLPDQLKGIQWYDPTQVDAHIPEMQVMLPNAPLNWSINVFCNRAILPTERFTLTVQFAVLPSDAVPGAAKPTIVNFSSDPIPMR